MGATLVASPTSLPPVTTIASTPTAPQSGASLAGLAALGPALAQVIQSLTALTAALGASSGPQAQAGAGTVEAGGPGQSAPISPSTNTAGCGCGGATTPTQSGPPPKGKAPADSPEQAPPGNGPAPDAPSTPAPPPPPTASTPPAGVPALETKSLDEIKAYIKTAADAYGANPKILDNIADGESTHDAARLAGKLPAGDKLVTNHTDINAQRGHPSVGMFQFIPTTFENFSKQAKAANPKAWEGLGDFNIGDWRQQALTTAWAIKNGHEGDWATWTKASAGLSQ
ncbi:MAG: hypothetical protein JWM98_2882 [Thermoleophilia bacterium]|nr:hypothetical protein [Thermoleophilia bacterium]